VLALLVYSSREAEVAGMVKGREVGEGKRLGRIPE
jgi:hypothetical protein